MSADWTCNSSFWTKEEDEILENALAMHFDDKDLLKKMEEALPGKSVDEIIHHYNELLEDINAIESESVLPHDYPEMQSNASQNLKADVEWQKGTPWTEQEHRSFVRGLEIYGKGDWRSIARHSVKTRTATQVASHAQKFFKRLSSSNKGNRRASILDIVSVDAEAAGTSQVPNTEEMIGQACGGSLVVTNTRNETDNMIGSACGGLQAVTITRNEAEDMTGPASEELQVVTNTRNGSMLPQESTNAEQQMIAVAGGIDDPMAEQEGANETAFLVDTAGIGNDLEALFADPMEEDNDISSIFTPSSSYSAAEAPTVFVPPCVPSSNTPPDEEALLYVDDLFID